MSIYPQSGKDWISRQGGLSGELKYLKNGPELWAIVDPAPRIWTQWRHRDLEEGHTPCIR
jgi:hypothetical protein